MWLSESPSEEELKLSISLVVFRQTLAWGALSPGTSPKQRQGGLPRGWDRSPPAASTPGYTGRALDDLPEIKLNSQLFNLHFRS